MKNSVINAIEQFAMLQKGDTVTVALSGGADSVALLHVLVSLKDDYGITVNAAHLNHSIRGEEALRDQQFSEELCRKLGVEFFCEKIDVPKFAQENHLSIELAARQLRYDFLNRVSGEKIATAHTASDNLETVVFNLTRGAGLKGLCGIPPVRGKIIRPVILCSREDIEQYCVDNGLEYVTDSTNLTDDYSRNKIRHKIIPILKEINGNVVQTVSRTTRCLSEDNTFLEEYAQRIVFTGCTEDGLLIDDFSDLPVSVAKKVIKTYCEICHNDMMLEHRHIDELFDICAAGVGKVNLPQGNYAVVKDNVLCLTKGEKQDDIDFKIKITKTQNVNSLFSNNMLDCDKIIGKLVVRTRLQGDEIRLNKRGCTKTLKKLFTEYKIPENMRKNLPVLADDEGVVWVHTIGVAQRCAIDKNTKNAYFVEIE